jgi:hypothetical protein
VITMSKPTAPSDPVVDAFVQIARDVHAGWLYLPTGARWLLVACTVVWFMVGVAESPIRLRLLIEAAHLYSRQKRWWTTDPKDTSRVLLSDLRADSERASGEQVTQPARAAFAVATEPVSLVEPDVRVCTECGAPVDDPADDLLRGLFEDEDAEPGPTGWKPGVPLYGTPPLQRNDAQAQRFRQLISDAIRRQSAS